MFLLSIFIFIIIIIFLVIFGSHLVMHRGYSWLCIQELPLAVLRGPYGMLGIEPGSAACKANALPAVLSLQAIPGIIIIIIIFAFWVTPGDAQGLLLALHSGITPGGAQGTIWDAGIRTRVGRVQGKRPTRCAIAPAPNFCFHVVLFGLER